MAMLSHAGASGAPRASPSLLSNFSAVRSEEHTSELQSRFDLVCRLLLEKKKPLKSPSAIDLGSHPAPKSSTVCNIPSSLPNIRLALPALQSATATCRSRSPLQSPPPFDS